MKLALLALLACVAASALAWWTAPAWPEVSADCDHISAMPGSVGHAVRSAAETDMVVIAPLEGGRALLCVLNHGAMVSGNGTHEVTLGSLVVLVTITVGQGAERVGIVPPVGWMVYPADLAETTVADGEAVTVMLFAGMM